MANIENGVKIAGKEISTPPTGFGTSTDDCKSSDLAVSPPPKAWPGVTPIRGSWPRHPVGGDDHPGCEL